MENGGTMEKLAETLQPLRQVTGAVITLCLLFGCGTLKAQEAAKIGVIFGYPTAAGVVFKPTERLAVLTDFSFSRQKQIRPLDSLVFENWSVEIGGRVYL